MGSISVASVEGGPADLVGYRRSMRALSSRRGGPNIGRNGRARRRHALFLTAFAERLLTAAPGERPQPLSAPLKPVPDRKSRWNNRKIAIGMIVEIVSAAMNTPRSVVGARIGSRTESGWIAG